MTKKKTTNSGNKAAAKASKKVKAAQKVERKEKKKVGKGKDAEAEEEDLESILEKMRREWEDAHKVTEELIEGPPSRRANATLTPCPSGNFLWAIGGEFFSDDNKAYFYKDVFRYSPEKDEWRKFVSPTCPGPRSAHAAVAMPTGGGKIFLFGGEFSSLSQTSFHHYGDFWCFDVQTHSWDRIETKIRPSARSGHRMAVWKHYIILFGGFYDPGVITRYLNDLWVFDTQEYTWQQIEFREGENRPSPRSGFSFLSTTDGILLHGGYCKEYVKGKRPVGIMLEDTWFLKLSITDPSSLATATTANAISKLKTGSKAKSVDPLIVRWERRKRPTTAFAPSIRSGCTMALWANRDTGILFGGVTDEDTGEETLESVFHNDLYGYQISGKGRWFSLGLKKPKKAGGAKAKKKKGFVPQPIQTKEDADEGNSDTDNENRNQLITKTAEVAPPLVDEFDPDDPIHTTPLPRYNAMLAVLRNTLYIYGGIFERGSREYTLDDFYSLPLDKLDRYICLKESDVVVPRDGEIESSSDEDDEDEDEDSDNSEEAEDNEDEGATKDKTEDTMLERGKKTQFANRDVLSKGEESNQVPVIEELEPEPETPQEEKSALREQATAFMGVSRDTTRSVEEIMSTPLPGETLAMFFARSREYWTGKAINSSDNRGKQLRRDGFMLAEEKYKEYKPVLEEVERILAEAGLDEDEMRRSAAAGPASAAQSGSRNRR